MNFKSPLPAEFDTNRSASQISLLPTMNSQISLLPTMSLHSITDYLDDLKTSRRRGHIDYTKLPTVPTDNGFIDAQFLIPAQKVPWKAICLATSLLVVGTFLLVFGSLVVSGNIILNYSDRMWPMIILGLLMFIPGAYHSNLEHDGWVNINLKHCLVPSETPIFTERGNITIQSLRSGQAIIKQAPLSEPERTQLRDLAAKNEFYQIVSTVISSDGTQTKFLSTIKACMLAEAELDDRLSVSLDYSGRVIAVTLLIASRSTCEGAVVPLSKLKEFTTSVYVRQSEIGPVPDTASYIQKLEREKEARERGEVKDNRSILAKYWMYIVPVVILLMVSSMANPDAAGNGGSGR